MKIIAFVGASESGKTRLIARLVPALKAKGLVVGVLKHCAHGFDLGGDDKDSSKFLSAGAEAVVLAGPGRTAVLRPAANAAGIMDFIRRDLGGADIVLVEGGKGQPALRKIEVLRAGVSEGLRTDPAELEAVVSDTPVEATVPVFPPDDVQGLADWLAGAILTGAALARGGKNP